MREKCINLCKAMFLGLLSFMFLFFGIHTSATITENPSTIVYDLDGNIVTNTNTFKINVETNLLLDNNGNDLLQQDANGFHYHLDAVTVTRHRRPMQIEYYVGDYTSNEYVGTDSGYVDFNDNINHYLLDINRINAKFETNIPTSYRMFPLVQGETLRTAPAYNGNDNPFVLQVLVAPVVTYPAEILVYHNRQDMRSPNPIGQQRTDIHAETEFWHVQRITRNVQAVNGQILNLRSIYNVPATHTAQISGGSRTGNLAYVGQYQEDVFTEENTVTMGSDSRVRTSLAIFYEVDDYGSPVVKPTLAISAISNATVAIRGGEPQWKEPTTSETLYVDNDGHMSKLTSYPFHQNADAFDEPDFALTNVPNNWMLAHKIDLTYRYLLGDSIVPTPPDPIIPEPPNPIVPNPPTTPEDEKNGDTVGQPPNGSDTINQIQTSDTITIGIAVGAMLIAGAGLLLLKKKKL